MEIIAFVLLHVIADKLFQSPEMRRYKFNSSYIYFTHVGIHALFMFLGTLMIAHEAPIIATVVLFVDLVVHSFVDYHTWKWYRYSVAWRNKDKTNEELEKTWNWTVDPVFWRFLAVEQFLHLGAITTVFYYLIKPFMG